MAEQLLRGGIPAVRTAIHLEREKASAEGRPAPQAEQLLALAEELLPRLKAAEWRDRAEAASKASDEISLRDLRSVVAGADLARDDETRELAATLRASLERRLAAGREEWQAEIGRHLEEGRIVRAVRLAGRPPEAGARLSGELAARLAHAAGAALNADVAPDRWLAVLEAVVASPVRREVKPAGLPTQASPEVLHAARQQVGRVPALAPMLGVTMPPPPGPSRPAAGTARAARRPPRGPAASRPRPPAAAGTPPAPDEPDAELAPPDLEERGRGATTEAGTPTSPEADTAEPDSPPHDATTEADGDPHDAVAEPPGASDDAPTDPPSARDDAVAEPPSAPEAEASEPASAPEAEASEPDSAPDDATGPPPGEPGTDGASTEPAQADS
ncbi:MAG TPA: hypothetical protein VKV25_06500 [Acidimicrobiales bacterium]|nr:hypothetical protein [Acidimicrobiales bacterium]